ncbi:WhiB family transcriptional regulator [Streptomyces hebeiensis]
MTTRAPNTQPGRYDWHNQAACRDHPNLFFPDSGGYHNARPLCAPCPVRDRCLTQAMTAENGLPTPFRHGMWGGLTPEERHQRDRVRTRQAETPQQENAAPKIRTGGKPLAPCGTRYAYERHVRRGEHIDIDCLDAYDDYRASRRINAAA